MKQLQQTIGFPEIPHIAKVLAIPDYGTVSVEVIETGTLNIVKGITGCSVTRELAGRET